MPMSLAVFVAYARPDEALWHELAKHLSLLRSQGVIETWDDRQIDPGEEWAPAIQAQLAAAEIILLLISADFLASDDCWQVAVTQAMAL
jgi:hypothetical protein